MRRLLLVVSILIAPCLAATPASGSPYELFGNGWNGDCAFASLANLVRYNWPSAPITADQVLAAWNAQPNDPFGYMITTGFGGHRISDYTEHTTASRTLVRHALANGGLVAWLQLPGYGSHAEAIVGMNARGVLGVLAPGVLGPRQETGVLITWQIWKREVRHAFTVTWAAPGQIAVDLLDTTSAGSPVTPFASFAVSPGGTVTMPEQSPPSLGAQYTFCGWSQTPGDPVVVYTPGSTATFQASTVLGPVYFPTAQGCDAWAG